MNGVIEIPVHREELSAALGALSKALGVVPDAEKMISGSGQVSELKRLCDNFFDRFGFDAVKASFEFAPDDTRRLLNDVVMTHFEIHPDLLRR